MRRTRAVCGNNMGSMLGLILLASFVITACSSEPSPPANDVLSQLQGVWVYDYAATRAFREPDTPVDLQEDKKAIKAAIDTEAQLFGILNLEDDFIQLSSFLVSRKEQNKVFLVIEQDTRVFELRKDGMLLVYGEDANVDESVLLRKTNENPAEIISEIRNKIAMRGEGS